VVGQRLLKDAPPDRRDEILTRLSTEHLEVRLRPAPTVPASAPNAMLDRMQQRIVAWEPDLAGETLRLATRADLGGRRDLVGALQIAPDLWLEFSSRDLFGRWPQLTFGLLSAAILTGGVLLAAAMLVRTLGTPLRALAEAADKVGHGAPVMVS